MTRLKIHYKLLIYFFQTQLSPEVPQIFLQESFDDEEENSQHTFRND